MLRSVAKLLVFFAVLATAVNAQCAVSCSFPRSQPVKVNVHHTCCKDPKAPVSSNRQPCPPPVLNVADLHSFQAPVCAPALFDGAIVLPLPAALRYARAGKQIYNRPDIPVSSILRI